MVPSHKRKLGRGGVRAARGHVGGRQAGLGPQTGPADLVGGVCRTHLRGHGLGWSLQKPLPPVLLGGGGVGLSSPPRESSLSVGSAPVAQGGCVLSPHRQGPGRGPAPEVRREGCGPRDRGPGGVRDSLPPEDAGSRPGAAGRSAWKWTFEGGNGCDLICTTESPRPPAVIAECLSGVSMGSSARLVPGSGPDRVPGGRRGPKAARVLGALVPCWPRGRGCSDAATSSGSSFRALA